MTEAKFQPAYREGLVLENEQIAPQIFRLRVQRLALLDSVKMNQEHLNSQIEQTSNATLFLGLPGQFYMLRAWGNYPLLARPLSISDITDTYIEFIYQVVGQGTKILSQLKPKTSLQLLGPLGKGFPCTDISGKIALIAGGIGIAPFLYLAKQLSSANNARISIDLIAGFQKQPYALANFTPYCNNIKVATESGEVGVKGYVTQLLPQSAYDIAYVCGPLAMMQAVKDSQTAPLIYLSLEAYMGCGIGACLGCQVMNQAKNNVRICQEGPVFAANEVILNAKY